MTSVARCVLAATMCCGVFLFGCGSSSDDRVTQREQNALPTEQLTLAGRLCPRESTQIDLAKNEVLRERRRGEREFAALTNAYRRHPEALVRTSYLASGGDDGHEDLSVRELVRSHLRGATEDGVSDSECFRQVAHRLRVLLRRE